LIDTLKLNLSDCEISAYTPLTIEPSPYLHDSSMRFVDYDLFVDNAGEIVRGKKAYYNGEKFYVSIKPKYSLQQDELDKKLLLDTKYISGMKVGTLQNIHIEEEKFNAGIFVQLSLPRYTNTTNFNSLTYHEEKKVLQQLEKDLARIGIKTNIWDSNLSRVDSFTNIVTDENFFSYANLFSVLEASRMQHYEYCGTTFLYRNGERQICIYDKILEMRNKLKNNKLYGFLPSDVMRLELRYLRKRKINNALSLFTLNDLYDNYDYLKENYKSDIETTIFKYDLAEVEKMTGNYVKEDMQYFYNKGSRLWFNNYLKMFGVASLLKLSNMETIIEKVNEVVDSDESKTYKNKRMIKSRIKNMLDELRFRLESSKLSSIVSTKTNRELYNELKEKFYRSAA
jgi:hypothetical protein